MEAPFAPGCFGSPLCCNARAPLCLACPLLAACQKATAERAQRLLEQWNVTAMVSKLRTRREKR